MGEAKQHKATRSSHRKRTSVQPNGRAGSRRMLLVLGALAFFLATGGVYLILGSSSATEVSPTKAPNEVAPSTGSVKVGNPAPDFALPSLDGKTVRLSDLRGQVVLINFWATWCPPCRMEMPAIQDAYEANHQKGFTVLAVSVAEPASSVRSFVQEFGLTFTPLLDSKGEVSSRYQAMGLPTSIFVDREGIIRAIHVGAMTPAQINDYLAEVLTP